MASQQQSTPARPWELILKTPQTLELRTFLTVWSGSDANSTPRLLEHNPDPRLERLYRELPGLHSELANAQRELSREWNRLAHVLKEAEATIQTRDNILAIISHELRNLFNTISMTTSLLGLPLPEEEKTIQLQVIQQAIGRMSRLLNDLLDVSAIESGRLRLEKSPLRLPHLLSEVCDSFQNEATQKALDLSCTLLEDFPLIQGDRGRLMQALTNLVSNAVSPRRTGESAPAHIAARRGNHFCRRYRRRNSCSLFALYFRAVLACPLLETGRGEAGARYY